MAITKAVNGVAIVLTAEEEAALLAERAAAVALAAEQEVLALTCTPRQMRLALLEIDMLDAVEAVVAAADQATQIAWEYAVLFERRDPRWDEMGAGIEKTPAEITALFRLAQTK